MALPDLMDHSLIHRRPFVLRIAQGPDRFPSRGQPLHQGHIQVSVHREGQGTGNGRGGHDQHMGRVLALGLEFGPLSHPEPVLFVGNGQGQGVEHHLVLDQSIGSHHRLDGTIRQPFQYLPAGFGRKSPGQKGRTDAGRFQYLLHLLVVLLCQDFRRRHQASLIAVLHRLGQGQESQGRFPGAHIPRAQPIHGLRTLHIIVDFLPCFFLAVRQGKAQVVQNLPDQRPAPGHFNALAVLLDLHPVVEQAALEKEQFLENQPLPGLFQKFRTFGKVDVLQGFQPGQELFGPEDFFRQAFRQFLPGQGQGLAHCSPDLVLGQAAGEGIGGKNPRCFRSVLFYMGQGRPRNAFGRASRHHLADDQHLIPGVIDPGHVGLGPEQDDFRKPGAVPDGDGGVLQVPGTPPVVHPYDGPPEQLHFSSGGQLTDGPDMGIIQIASLPGKMVQQVADGYNIDIFEFQGLFGPDAFESGYWFLPPHGHFLLFSWFSTCNYNPICVKIATLSFKNKALPYNLKEVGPWHASVKSATKVSCPATTSAIPIDM